jgi:hypothetical protein
MRFDTRLSSVQLQPEITPKVSRWGSGEATTTTSIEPPRGPPLIAGIKTVDRAAGGARGAPLP